jgi:hypothetical protein
MPFFLKLAAVIGSPFLMFSSFWGMGPHSSTTPSHFPVEASSTMSSSTEKSNEGLHLGFWLGKGNHDSDKHATTTSATSTQSISLNPTSGLVGTSVTITGTGFASSSVVHFGPGVITAVTASAGGTQLTFKVPPSVGPDCTHGKMCPMYLVLVTPHTYNVSVSTGATTTVSKTFTVTKDPNATTTTAVEKDTESADSKNGAEAHAGFHLGL